MKFSSATLLALPLLLFFLSLGCIGSGNSPEESQIFPSEWCKAGSYWNRAGESSSSWKVIGMEVFNGKPMCHAVMESSGEFSAKTDIFFNDETGDYCVVTKTADGKSFESCS